MRVRHSKTPLPRNWRGLPGADRALCQEVVTHEAVHAAYAFAERTRKKWPDRDNPQEAICYPAGRIAKRINNLIHDAGLYPKHPGRVTTRG